jgi:hypothetical protein
MWQKFDLKHGELEMLCRSQGMAHLIPHARSSYENYRRQCIERLEESVSMFIKNPANRTGSSGWVSTTRGTSALNKKFPEPPSEWQVKEYSIRKLGQLRRVWAPIDILSETSFTSKTENVVNLATTRVYTYIRNRAVTYRKKEHLSIGEKMRMYLSWAALSANNFSVAALDPHGMQLRGLERANIRTHPAMTPRVHMHPSIVTDDEGEGESEEELPEIDFGDDDE